MIVGTAQVDITPRSGIELSGFAVRRQPSTGVLDSLAVRALYLEDGPERLLWLHADVLAVEGSLVDELRRDVEDKLGIPGSRVLVSATHTHSGPPTVHLTECGDYDASYVGWLEERLVEAARSASGSIEPADLVTAEGVCRLAVDRRGSPMAHTDLRVPAVGWRRSNGTFKAVLLSYGMHPVCLSGTEISADWPGVTAARVSQSLPGGPIVLVCSGACGNVNPPRVGVSTEQMHRWGDEVAGSVLPALRGAQVLTTPTGRLLNTAFARVSLPLEHWTLAQTEAYADHCLADTSGHREFGDKYRVAIATWRKAMAERIQRGAVYAEAELMAIRLGPAVFVAANAESFSCFAELIGGDYGVSVYPVGCSGGMLGYLAPASAHAEGGYEVDHSMLFYNQPRLRRGSLELLAEQASRLIDSVIRPSNREDLTASVNPCRQDVCVSGRQRVQARPLPDVSRPIK